jgi:hypothetical protein
MMFASAQWHETSPSLPRFAGRVVAEGPGGGSSNQRNGRSSVFSHQYLDEIRMLELEIVLPLFLPQRARSRNRGRDRPAGTRAFPARLQRNVNRLGLVILRRPPRLPHH